VFLSVLEVHNFAAVGGEDGITKIVPSSLVKQSPTPTSFVVPRPRGDEYITQVYQLKHTSVQELVPVLRPLLPPTDHFAAHAQSNTLVFTGTAANVKRVIKVIDRLDQPQIERNIHVVYLRYAKAVDLVKLLSNVLTSRQQAAGAKGATPSEPINVQADESTNALVIQSAADDFVYIQEIVDKLDIRRAQVFMEALIAEVSTDMAQDLGIRWEFGDDNLQTGETSGSVGFSDVTGGLNIGYLQSLIENLRGEVVPQFQVVLSALQSDANTNILSTPTILTLDNETAEIVVGQEVPFVTGQYTSTGTTTTTDPDTGTTVTNPFQTIERKEVGIKLKLTPQINEGNAIRLVIEQEVSSISPTTVQGASDLITNTRSIKATVMIDNGEIIVLGGLIQDDFKDNVDKVPLLGDVPVLGHLFRKSSKNAVKQNLMFFLRPRIIRTRSDLAGFTAEKYRHIQEQQEESLPNTKHLLRKEKPPVLPDVEIEDGGPARSDVAP